jgi:ABC-2 type transport system permease protein
MPDWSVIICTLIGILLVGGALISIDIFISSLTESQIISAVVGMAVGLIMYMWSSITSMISVDWIASALNTVSFTERYTTFTYGVLDLSAVVFFLSVIALFIFFTIRVLEKKRWS